MSEATDNELEDNNNAVEPEFNDDLLMLSDAELMSMNFDDLVAKNNGEVVAPKADESGTTAAAAVKKDDESDEDDDEAAKAKALADAGAAKGEGSDEPPGEVQDPAAVAAAKAAEGDKTKVEPTEPVVEANNLKPEDQLAKLFAPFKANGKDMNVDNVDDAISLMQMGANYTKKMAALKPNLKLMKLLENNGLLSEEKLSFLIDLDKKSPQAISKLLKDSGIDPLDVDVEKVGEYKPNTYTVDDRELALDAVLDEVQGTPTYSKMIDVVSNKWDAPSKQVIADNPQLLKVINGHMISGHYDLISNEIERERTFGRLAGLSDIEAYRQVGDALDQRGAFAQLGQKPAAAATPQKEVVPVKAKPDDSALKDKKRAASPTKATAAAPGVDPEFNPLSLSDDDFAKFDFNKIK